MFLGPANEDDKFREGKFRPNIYQSTADRQADSKLDTWASKTNIFQHSKGQFGPGMRIKDIFLIYLEQRKKTL